MSARRFFAGGLVAPLAVLTAASASADVPYQFVPGTPTVVQTGPGAHLAGGHPDVSIDFRLVTDPAIGTGRAAQAARAATIDLPRGMVGDPRAAVTCPMEDVVASEKPEHAGRCPRAAAVGTVKLDATYPNGAAVPLQSRRLFRVAAGPNEVVAFATSILASPMRMAMTVGPSGGYRVRATAGSLTQAAFLRGLSVTLWGVPAERQGPGSDCDAYVSDAGTVCMDFLAPADPAGDPSLRFGGPLPGAPRRPFITNPGVCGASLSTDLRIVPYGTVFAPIEATINAGTITGCEDQPFAPSVVVTPRSKRAGAPSGYDVAIDVQQQDDPDRVAAAQLKDVAVTLPSGVAISPPVANGLDACDDAAFDLLGDTAAACPDTARIGGMTIETPILEDPLAGRVYLGRQRSSDPGSGEMFRLLLVAQGPGALIKLEGALRADPRTGQLTVSFANNPQLPFSRMTLRLDGGDRAPLTVPAACGQHTASARFTSWAGHARKASTSFVINEACPTGRFSPAFVAGTSNSMAGSFAPFTMTVARSDTDSDLRAVRLDLPQGLFGALGSVPLCGDAPAAAGTCPAASRIGSTSILVGSGGRPLPMLGAVSVTGPYKGAPFGLSIAVPATVGPLALGAVIVRAALHVDATYGRATVVTDPLPPIVGGVPVRLRQLSITLDRPGFMRNATSCRPSEIYGSFGAIGGGQAVTRFPYQARGCETLKLDPKLSLEWTGKTQMRERKHPGVKVRLEARSGQANLKAVKLTLPLTASLDPENATELCKPAEAASGTCPASSRIGWARATTPTLHHPVEGPVYFVEGTRVADGRAVRTFPKLLLKMSGQGVALNLWAETDVDDEHRLTTTFTSIPDVSLRNFELTINSGKRGILKAANDVCGAPKGTKVRFTGHNDGVTERRLSFTAPSCKTQIVSATGSSSRVSVRLGGIGAGRITLRGKRVVKSSRTIKRSDAATLRATFRPSRAQRALLNRGRTIKVPLRVTFKPKKVKAKTGEAKTVKAKVMRKTLRIQGVRRRTSR